MVGNAHTEPLEAAVTPLSPWFKSSYSGNSNQCVETRIGSTAVQVRDTKDNGNGPVFTFDAAEWSAFIDFAVDTAH